MELPLAKRIEAAAAVLRRGGIVAYPTETYYGLAALARDAAAVARVAAVKGRPDEKPLPVLAADRAMAEEVAVLDPVAARLADRFWPGPLTLVVPARPGLPGAVTGGTGTVGIRVPGSHVARALCRAAGGPLVATSANLSGEPPAARPEDLPPALLARLDGVLEAGSTPGGLPSTVVAVEGSGVRLLRRGPVPLEAIREVADSPA